MMNDLIRRQDALELVKDVCDAIMSCCGSHYDEETEDEVYDDIHEVATILKCNKEIRIALKNMPSAQPELAQDLHNACTDAISRQAAIDALRTCYDTETITMDNGDEYILYEDAVGEIEQLPSAQPERKWIPCSNPPKHHKDVIVRGIEAIGNVTVHKVMQWDVDTWRPTDYAPSVMWKEWSEI